MSGVSEGIGGRQSRQDSEQAFESLLSAKLVKLTPVATDDLFEMVARRKQFKISIT